MIRNFCLFFLFAGSMMLSFLAGTGEIHRWRSLPAPDFPPLVLGINPEKEFPVTEHKSFAFVLYAHNAASWCERSLRSLFAQDYDYFRVLFIDDASVDSTLEKAQQFIVDHHLEERVITVRNETKEGMTASLYRAAQVCLDKEILIPLDAGNWLSHEGVLTKLNRVFQNPDVWIAFGAAIDYPSYSLREPPAFDPAEIERKGFFLTRDPVSCAFYAGLFKSIRLPDLFDGQGCISENPACWQLSLLEQAGGRSRVLPEPLFFHNQARSQRPLSRVALFMEREPYRPLAQLPLLAMQKKNFAEVLLFSENRPLQLYAALESMERYLKGASSISVIYRADTSRFETAYEVTLGAFEKVKAIRQSKPHKDFKPLLEQLLSESDSKYVLLGTDETVMKDFVDLDLCSRVLDRTAAFALYLAFGRNIQYSELEGKPLSLPISVEVGNGIFAWDVKRSEAEWRQGCNFAMNLYSKADLKRSLSENSFKSAEELLEAWNRNLPNKTIGLYFKQSKAVKIPLKAMSEEELLESFQQGLKMDIEPLFQVNNPAPQVDWAPEWIQR